MSYKPLLVGKTKSHQELDDTDLPFVDEELFDIIQTLMSQYNIFQENSIVTDYFYTIFLDFLSKYKDQIIVFGSYMLNKKYGTSFNPSDLDLTKLYDSAKSKRQNIKEMKLIGDEVYQKMNQVNGIHLDFFKEINFIYILSFIYASKKYNIKGYLDMNTILDEFYKPEDFMTKNGISLVEYYSIKSGMNNPQTIRYPRFSVQTTNAFGDITNSILQYIYSINNEKKKTLLIKMRKIIKNLDFSSQADFETLENMLIRYLLRNIYFFETTRRTSESDIILFKREIELPDIIQTTPFLEEALRKIIQSDNYNRILNSIANSNNRKDEITFILKNYKKMVKWTKFT